MEFIENMFNSKLGSLVIMIGIFVLFVGFLRLLYGPKGFLRKNLWAGIEDDTETLDTNTLSTSNINMNTTGTSNVNTDATGTDTMNTDEAKKSSTKNSTRNSSRNL